MGGIGLPELLVILFVLVLFFGAKRLPELARNLGRGIREFQKEIKSENSGDKQLKE
ncbi:MAG: twin-arginine translocase TatA/TatE family subunit [Calditrichaeota bacterium]|nr:twin-arginine translocase TatA/TatE family subunit [Calditrichota bacterium]